MLKDLHVPKRLPLGALVTALVLTAGGGAAAMTHHAKTRSPRARAARVLRQLGYSHVHLSCSRRGICNWRGLHGGRSCSGRITASKRSRAPLRFSAIRCAGGPPLPVALGFNTYTDQLTVAKQREVGATVTRLFVNWWDVEPQPGGWNWNSIDQQYQQILAGGLRPLIVVNGAPCWATSSCQLLFESPPTPSHDPDWSAYVRAVIARYPRAVGVEVWNEPNLAAQFYPQADPRRYTQLLSEAYTAVKSVNKDMPVISGGVLMNDTAGVAAPGYASRTFLAGMFAAGAGRYMDGLGIHVYPTDTEADGSKVWDPAGMSRALAQVDGIEASAGIQQVPIWVTEMGVSTATGTGFPRAVTPDQQASELLTMIHMAQADGHVRVAMIDSLQDASPDILGQILDGLTGSALNFDVSYTPVEEGLGVYTDSWVPKPAACSIAPVFAGALRCGT
jgi:hypothetical protein